MKQQLFFSLCALLLTILFACGESDEQQAKAPKKEVLVEYKNGIYTEYYPGRKAIKFQGPQTKEGIRNGRWYFYAENGTEQSMAEYKDGKNHGFIFVRYPNGAMRYSGEFNMGKESGQWRFYKEDGSFDFEKNYSQGAQ